jgi:acetoacetyl-[acyl-carrier protein] synthase
MSLGTWAHGWLPGILTAPANAADVHATHLDILRQHRDCDPTELDVALVNAKGFGGNNATATLLAPHVARHMMEKRFGTAAMDAWRARNEAVRTASADHDARATAGEAPPIYRFDQGVLRGEDLDWQGTELRVPGYAHGIDLSPASPYEDWQ